MTSDTLSALMKDRAEQSESGLSELMFFFAMTYTRQKEEDGDMKITSNSYGLSPFTYPIDCYRDIQRSILT